jgi:CAAX prenyl protease-like protein
LSKHPRLAYILPFAVYIGLLTAMPHLRLPDALDFGIRIVVTGTCLLLFSRAVIDWRTTRLWGSVLLGVAVFAIWVAPDVLWPGYRGHWLFQNPLTGTLSVTISEEGRNSMLVLGLRTFRAVLIVPLVEELFWRGWLLRWLVRAEFLQVPLGSYTRQAFWISAVLFALEHGAYWEVGLAAGAIYNWWLGKTRSLADCIVAHAVTNACLSLYVILLGRWEYWL